MKTSNKLLLAFFGLLILTMVFTAIQLKAEYKKINLKDKFRNYDHIALHSSIKHLVVQGSASNKADAAIEFFVDCVSGNKRELVLPKDNFLRTNLTYTQSGDTLIFHSTLPYSLATTIFLSGVNPETIEANATRVLLDGIKLEHLRVTLERNAAVTISRTQIKDFTVNITDKSYVKLGKNSVVDNLVINLQKQSAIELGEIKLNKVSLQMSASAKITASKENLLLLQKSGNLK